jgi:hypothetical protein
LRRLNGPPLAAALLLGRQNLVQLMCHFIRIFPLEAPLSGDLLHVLNRAINTLDFQIFRSALRLDIDNRVHHRQLLLDLRYLVKFVLVLTEEKVPLRCAIANESGFLIVSLLVARDSPCRLARQTTIHDVLI